MQRNTVEKGTAFENDVAEIYRNLEGVTKIIQNHSLHGIEIDIYVEMQIPGGIKIRLAIDAKNHSAKVSADKARKCVTDFTVLRNNYSIEKGIIVSAFGFTKDANAVIVNSGYEAIQMKDLRIRALDFSQYLLKWIDQFKSEKILKYISLSANRSCGEQIKKLDDYLLQWIKNGTSHITLLGNYGSGKSTTLKHVMAMQAEKYIKDPEAERIPIFIELKGFRQAPKSKSLITDILVNDFGLNINYFKFKEMNESGRFLIILDGFDEMADRVYDGLPYHHFDELSGFAAKKGKVILSSRTHYFRDQEHVLEMHEQQNDLMNRVEEKSGYEIVFISNFTEKDINAYLRAAFGDDWQEYQRIIKNTYDLYSLAEVPILLNMIVQVLPDMIREKTVFNRSELYRVFTDKWLRRENWRQSSSKADRLLFCKELAIHFYTNKVYSVHWSELPEFIRRVFTIDKRSDLDIFDSDVRTSNFLKREENNGQYSFVHKSFMEYFAARYFHETIVNRIKNGLDDLRGFTGSKVIYEFLIEMLTKDDLVLLMRDIKRRESIDYSKLMSYNKNVEEYNLCTNAESLGNCIYLLLNRGYSSLDEIYADSASLKGAEISNVSFSGAHLRGASFENCILNSVSFSNAELTGATFRGAKLRDVDFTSATINNVDLRGTMLTGDTMLRLSLAKYWGGAKLDENLRKQLDIAYRKSSKVSSIVQP